MSLYDPGLIRSRGSSGEPVVRLGLPLVDDYLEFLEGRCRPNTVLAAAYDLRVFFGVVAKPPADVASADVLGFITAQRTGRSEGAVVQPVVAGEENVGVATSTVARRLSIVSGFFGYLQARGEVSANPVPRGLPTRRERSRPGQAVPHDLKVSMRRRRAGRGSDMLHAPQPSLGFPPHRFPGAAGRSHQKQARRQHKHVQLSRRTTASASAAAEGG